MGILVFLKALVTVIWGIWIAFCVFATLGAIIELYRRANWWQFLIITAILFTLYLI